MIKINHLSFWFGPKKVIDQVDLHVPAGSIYGFLGPNGAGKTTLIKLMLGLLHFHQGLIEINGWNIKNNLKKILAFTGNLIEAPSLYGHLTGRENLLMSVRLRGLSPSRADEMLELTGLSWAAGKKVRKYSHGMKQRLGIALALISDPDLLILDEPFNGLDPAGMIEFRSLFLKLQQQGKTIFLSSHMIDEVEKVCNYVSVIHKGKILFDGSVEQLKEKIQHKNEVQLEVDQPDKALKWIPFPAEIKNHLIICRIHTRNDIPDLIAVLLQHGIKIYKIVPQINLEKAFIEIINSSNHESIY